jgi:hypothetical protein
MRLVRPLLFFAFLGVFAAAAQSQTGPPGGPGMGGVNFFVWEPNSPTPTKGGVDLSVKFIPTTGYTCTEVKFQVIDHETAVELDEFVQPNPTGMVVSKSFNGYASNLKLRIVASAVFKNGTTLDPKDMENYALTK